MAEKSNVAHEEYRHFVRVVNTDLDGKKNILIALTKIKGISQMFANAILVVADVEKTKKTGYLSDSEVERIESILLNPSKHDIPVWLLNRRRDYESGENVHLINADLEFEHDNDLKRLKKIKSYKGLRHSWGLTVRGQRTKSNFRKNKGKVTGVKKKKAA